MSETYQPDLQAPFIIGATGMTAILQNIRVIISSEMYSVPLDRGFAHDNSFIDSPAPLAAARLTASLMDALEKYEPRIEIDSIEFATGDVQTRLMQGALQPKITFHLKKGVEL